MKLDKEFDDHDRIVTFDIETTHWDPDKGETVAIGVGHHEPRTPGTDAQYESFARSNHGITDEQDLVRKAFRYIDELDGDVLVSYNGTDFDMDFLAERSTRFDSAPSPPALHTTGQHIDLFTDRKTACDPGEKWPSLEECLSGYNYPVPKTIWNGAPLDNSRFGDEFGPAFLDVVATEHEQAIAAFREVLEHYLNTDLEANIALYYADRGLSFDPVTLGVPGEFSTELF
ncbi:ribonuclease H-like domain-containing protein [Halorubrum ejinorense]|uniref:Ribonuclease H-like domain-containing protein n=1 Tax=Halorubrum ejinorense TaxID=425309 RepID=A0AAV3SSV8_9EURY